MRLWVRLHLRWTSGSHQTYDKEVVIDTRQLLFQSCFHPLNPETGAILPEVAKENERGKKIGGPAHATALPIAISNYYTRIYG
jgi:hypothetical protein